MKNIDYHHNAKKALMFLYVFFTCHTIICQENSNLSYKFSYTYGNILKLDTKHLEYLVNGPIQGGEIALEWQTTGKAPWTEYFNYPKIGIGTAYLNLNNPSKLGNLWSVYPYLKIPIIRAKNWQLAIKPGFGISYLTKTFRDNPTLDPNGEIILSKSNASIGSHLNVYFAGGANLEIPIFNSWKLHADFGWNHASNGSVIQPNSGINMINSSIGIAYTPQNIILPTTKSHADVEKKFTTEFILSSGARQLYYKDNRFYPIASIAASEFYRINNIFRIGIGLDGFYDGVFDGNSQFKRTYLATNEFRNKIRLGTSIQNEFVMGKITAGFHFGIYLFNPLKNLEPCGKDGQLIYPEARKGLIYKYNIENEDGWLYTRASLKYSMTKHLIASIGLKTHLYKAEFIEWGIGYRFE